MARISITALAEAPLASLPAGELTCTGTVATRSLIAGDSAHLHLYYSVLEPGAVLAWNHPATDFCAYVLKGMVEVNGVISVDQGGCVFIEHGSSASVSTERRAILALFQNREPGPKEGGHVHVIQNANVPQTQHTPGRENVASALIADALCPTCDLWLHGNTFPENDGVDLHSHSEDEIILVTSGQIVLGNRRYGPNTAVAVAKATIYGFKSGVGGLGFLNFRAGSPTATSAKDKRLIDEGEFFRSRLGRPQHVFIGGHRGISSSG